MNFGEVNLDHNYSIYSNQPFGDLVSSLNNLEKLLETSSIHKNACLTDKLSSYPKPLFPIESLTLKYEFSVNYLIILQLFLYFLFY